VPFHRSDLASIGTLPNNSVESKPIPHLRRPFSAVIMRLFAGVNAMSRFPGKKLPRGWVYVPSRREVRELLRNLAADVRRVEFAGTGSGPSSVGLLLGYLERRVAKGAWCFYLRLWGVPQAAVSEHRHELAHAALDAIAKSVAECLASPPADVVKPTQLLLRFAVGAKGVTTKCRVELVDRFSFYAGCWWQSPEGESESEHLSHRAKPS
jgi:hypothetical protein